MQDQSTTPQSPSILWTPNIELRHGRPRLSNQLVAMIEAHGSSANCLDWKSKINEHGYGIVLYDGDYWRVHRLAYKITHGRIYRALDVMHSCDRPCCFSTAHLSQGTREDNMRDASIKGRTAKFALTAEMVRQIRLRAESRTLTNNAIAEEFGVSGVLIGLIIRRKIWKHA